MQQNIPITILQEGHENLKQSLLSNLEVKGRYVRNAKNGELTSAKINRINSEEKHIMLCIATMDASDNLIKALEEKIQKLTEQSAIKDRKINYFSQEARDYMDKYYNLL